MEAEVALTAPTERKSNVRVMDVVWKWKVRENVAGSREVD